MMQPDTPQSGFFFDNSFSQCFILHISQQLQLLFVNERGIESEFQLGPAITSCCLTEPINSHSLTSLSFYPSLEGNYSLSCYQETRKRNALVQNILTVL